MKVSDNPHLLKNVHLSSYNNNGEFNQYALGEEKAYLEQPVSETYAKKIRHAYLAAVSYTDAQIGKVLKELKASGLDKNTVIIIWGDHGWHLGDQRMWGKHTLFENALKSTLIIKEPSIESQPNRIDQIVESVDIYPTILEIAQLKPKTTLDGMSLIPLLRGKKNWNQPYAYSYFKME
ncbi:sulfatase-like hydrolase/transferase [Winogradskyella maritima]|nr:sulfatase-like hydrolase/transferase [Winogradskyella maritima]